MEREVKDAGGTTWTCIQAYTGLKESSENHDAAEVKGQNNTYWVVCTPSGGAKSVRLQLPDAWETAYSDAALLSEIEAQQAS